MSVTASQSTIIACYAGADLHIATVPRPLAGSRLLRERIERATAEAEPASAVEARS